MLSRSIALYLLALIPLSMPLSASERVRVVETPNGGSPAHAERGVDGTIHLLYETRNQPFLC